MTLDKESQDPHGFDPEIRDIERKIVKFFAEKAYEFTGRHPIIATVMTYFYIRKTLTQRDLQILTGLSAGTISKSVRQLIEMNVVTKDIIPGTHTHNYKMESLPFTSPKHFLRTESLLGEMEQELKRIKETLDANAEEMQNLEAYQKIYATVTQILKLLSSTPIFVAKLEEELKKLTKDV